VHNCDDQSCFHVFSGSRPFFVVLFEDIYSRVEPLDCAIAKFSEVVGLHHGFRFAKFDTSVICHVLILCLGSFILQDMF